MNRDEYDTEGGGSVDVTHNVCCCTSPEAVAAGKCEAYDNGFREGAEHMVRDTLGLLEALELLAKRRHWVSTTDINVIWRGDHFDYEIRDVGGIWKDRTRDEVLALLAGEKKKE